MAKRGRPPTTGPTRQVAFRIGPMAKEFEELLDKAMDVYSGMCQTVGLHVPGIADLYRAAVIRGLKQILDDGEGLRRALGNDNP